MGLGFLKSALKRLPLTGLEGDDRIDPNAPAVDVPTPEPQNAPVPSQLDPKFEPRNQPQEIPLTGRPSFGGNLTKLGPPAPPSRLDQLQSEYNAVGAAPQTFKGKLTRALTLAVPTIAGAAFGGSYGATGAAEGTAEQIATQKEREAVQRKSLLTEMENERQRNERMQEREMTTEAARRGHEERLQGIRETNEARKDIQGLKGDVATQLGELSAKIKNRGQDAQLRSKGLKFDENGQIVPVSYEELPPEQQALYDLRQAQTEHANAQADFEKTRNDPNSPAFKLAQQRLNMATQRLQLSQQQTESRLFGTNNGQALPGALLTDEGTPVGSSFQANVRPTGTQRTKADMATSASEQLSDIQRIIQKRPDVFGPIGGRKTDFTVWLGSEDPDAKAFISARDIASGHLAGTFGARGKQTVQDLQTAIGQFKDNPQAALAGLAQVQKATKLFETQGTPKTVGSNAAKDLGLNAGVMVRVRTADGQTGTVARSQLPQFLKDNPGAQEVK